jgi:hypothetical protein
MEGSGSSASSVNRPPHWAVGADRFGFSDFSVQDLEQKFLNEFEDVLFVAKAILFRCPILDLGASRWTTWRLTDLRMLT